MGPRCHVKLKALILPQISQSIILRCVCSHYLRVTTMFETENQQNREFVFKVFDVYTQ